MKVFGHSLFNKNISTFSPVDDAVPRDNYKLGPGDEIVFILSGSEEDTRSVTVNRDGNLMFPLIGPVNVTGMTFNELQKLTSTRYENEFVGVKSMISLRKIKSN